MGLVAAIVATVAVTGCGSAGVKDEVTGISHDGVLLLAAGNGPKDFLRLDVREGTTEKLTMTMDMTGAQAGGAAVKVPTMSMGMVVKVTHVSDAGDITSDFHYSDVQVDATVPGAAEVRKQLAPLVGVHGTIVTDRRGVVKESDITVPDDLEPTMKSVMDSLKNQLQSMTVPYPEEAVGVGSRWSYSAHPVIAGIRENFKSTYTLVSRSGDTVVLSSAVEQSAPEQDPAIPNLPPGAKVHLDSQRSSGTGTTTVDLTAPLPVVLRSTFSTDVRMTVTADGQTQPLSQHMDMKVRLDRD